MREKNYLRERENSHCKVGKGGGFSSESDDFGVESGRWVPCEDGDHRREWREGERGREGAPYNLELEE